MDANADQVAFQAAVLARQEFRQQRFLAELVKSASRNLRQMLIDLLGLDLPVPRLSRKKDGTGPAFPFALISNSVELSRVLLKSAEQAEQEVSALNNEAFDAFSANTLKELQGQDSGDPGAKIAAAIATLTPEDMRARSYNEASYAEDLRKIGIDTVDLESALPAPVPSWEREDAEATATSAATSAIDAPLDSAKRAKAPHESLLEAPADDAWLDALFNLSGTGGERK